MVAQITAKQFWTDRLASMPPSAWVDARKWDAEAQANRSKAKFNTGSISVTASVALQAITAWVRPAAVIEVGTFIGLSTRSLCGNHPVYTCDVSNDCLGRMFNVEDFPYQTSTQMLKTLRNRSVRADLFFFDGLLSDEDVSLILSVSAPNAVYVVDDYNERFKGVVNVEKLRPRLANYLLLPAAGPVKVDTTLAALVPEVRL